jgi:hypothetical protein
MSQNRARLRPVMEKFVTGILARYLTPAPSIPGFPAGHRVIEVRTIGAPREIEPVALDARLDSLGVTDEMLGFLREDCEYGLPVDGLTKLTSLFQGCQTVLDVVNVIEVEYYRALEPDEFRALECGVGAVDLMASPEDLPSDTSRGEFSFNPDELRAWNNEPFNPFNPWKRPALIVIFIVIFVVLILTRLFTKG